MTKADREKMYESIERHGNNLNVIFSTGLNPIVLCKKLHRLENKAHRLCTHECNTGEDCDPQLDKILIKVKDILGATDTKIGESMFINGDPRGYALKIKDSYVREHNLEIECDWGGYGLIAPDFTPNNY